MPDIIIDETINPIYLTSYKSYIAMLTQSDTANPVAVVLNANDSNFLGNIVWTRGGAGGYAGTLSGVFTLNKTFMPPPGTLNAGSRINFYRIDANSVAVETSSSAGVFGDDYLYETAIEIRVYP